MRCPRCKGKLKTIDSRERDGGLITWRRRECTKCMYRFSTQEITEETLAKHYVKIQTK